MSRRPSTKSRRAVPESAVTPRQRPRPCNSLDGKRWLLNSLSVWSDLRKLPEEVRLKHPAQFPVSLVSRVIESFLPAGPHRILDPFSGSGTTLVAARLAGKAAVGIELSTDYVDLTLKRLDAYQHLPGPVAELHQGTALAVNDWVADESIDLCVTSPPYWDILGQRRSADNKSQRDYGNLPGDLSLADTYDEYLRAMEQVFAAVWKTLKPGAHCAIVVMDLRKRDQFFPLHSDLARQLTRVGYKLDDFIIWNRQANYNNLRPLGYPAVFRINKVHEFIILMQKPGRLLHAPGEHNDIALKQP